MSSVGGGLDELFRCFQGVIPSILATADRAGVPNVTYVSQIFQVDGCHVGLSRQFFNKTSRNLEQNPFASAELYDPVTLQAWRLRLRHLRSERSGPVFDSMSMRIEAIASVTGMKGIFRLLAADIFEVVAVQRVEGFLTNPDASSLPGVTLEGVRSELRGLQWISQRISHAHDLESLLEASLAALEEFFGFHHTKVLLHDDLTGRLITLASRGYEESGIGAEVAFGEGLIGTAAKQRRVLRMTGIDAGLRYGRAVRREVEAGQSLEPLRPEIPLPGLPGAKSTLIIPLWNSSRLVGVLAAESAEATGFDEWHEAYLEVVGNQIAIAIERHGQLSDDAPVTTGPAEPGMVESAGVRRTVSMMYYRSDDCVFVNGDYLVRSLPGRILWRILASWRDDGRTEFTNRELRLDETLGLPAIKDNLESRLILLRKRLEEKCPEIRIAPAGRGRFALQVSAEVEMVEK